MIERLYANVQIWDALFGYGGLIGKREMSKNVLNRFSLAELEAEINRRKSKSQIGSTPYVQVWANCREYDE